MRRGVPERQLEPPENYDMEPEPCRKCKEDPCHMDVQDTCPILEKYEAELEAEHNTKKLVEEQRKQEVEEEHEEYRLHEGDRRHGYEESLDVEHVEDEVGGDGCDERNEENQESYD